MSLATARFDLREALRDLANALEAGSIDDWEAIDAALANLASFEGKLVAAKVLRALEHP